MKKTIKRMLTIILISQSVIMGKHGHDIYNAQQSPSEALYEERIEKLEDSIALHKEVLETLVTIVTRELEVS